MPPPWLKIMRIATISKMTPPATSSERSDRCMTRRKPSPKNMKKHSTAKAIAFAVLCFFMFFGEGFLRVMHLSERSLEVAGGVILLMVAIRMIFSQGGGIYGVPEGKVPLIFPLAIPLLAGP